MSNLDSLSFSFSSVLLFVILFLLYPDGNCSLSVPKFTCCSSPVFFFQIWADFYKKTQNSLWCISLAGLRLFFLKSFFVRHLTLQFIHDVKTTLVCPATKTHVNVQLKSSFNLMLYFHIRCWICNGFVSNVYHLAFLMNFPFNGMGFGLFLLDFAFIDIFLRKRKQIRNVYFKL